MPQINFTIPDSSPIIKYSPLGAWGDSDAATDKYTNGTFHFTYVANATAEFSFVGTGVSLHGARRQNHDFYTDTLDGKDTFSASSHTDDPVGEFNVTLYERTNLPYGKHTVQLSNTPTNGTAYVDLDWVNIITGDNNANTPNNDIWLDNTASNFTWDDSWRQGTNDFTPEYHDSTFSLTNTKGGKATLNFYGNAVALYGATSSNHGPYSVSLDGGDSQPFNGSQIAFRPQQLLYLASGLKTGQHTLTLVNDDDQTFTDIDFAIVSQYGVTQAAAPPPSSSSAVFPTGSATTTGLGPSTPVLSSTATTSGQSAADDSTSAANTQPTSAASHPGHSRVGTVVLGALALSSLLLFSF